MKSRNMKTKIMRYKKMKKKKTNKIIINFLTSTKSDQGKT